MRFPERESINNSKAKIKNELDAAYALLFTHIQSLDLTPKKKRFALSRAHRLLLAHMFSADEGTDLFGYIDSL